MLVRPLVNFDYIFYIVPTHRVPFSFNISGRPNRRLALSLGYDIYE